MKETHSPSQGDAAAITRAELELFLSALTHEIRNRLSGISLEAADLAEQSVPDVDASRLQQQIQDCSTLLKKVRELVATDEPGAVKISLVELTKKLKDRSL
jgi:nitrogen-specific signal transduction histidine kinase